MIANKKAALHAFQYELKQSKLSNMWFINLLINIITLGINSFWAKARMRKYIISCVQFAGNKFYYTASGWLLCKGFFKGLFVLISISVISSAFATNNIVGLINIVLMWYLINVVTYQKFRHIFSMTNWKSTYFNIEGSANQFAFLKIHWTLVNIVTLGLTVPHTDKILYSYMIENLSFANEKFVVNSINTDNLSKVHLKMLLLFIPTCGMYYFWYKAAFFRELFSCISYKHLKFKSTHTGLGMLWLFITNLVIHIGVLGLGSIFTTERKICYLATHVFILGDIDFLDKIASDNANNIREEGLGEFLAYSDGL